MTVNELIADIKNGPAGGYLFYGSEEYLKRFYLGRLRKAVLGDDETLSSFNQYIIKWGEDGAAELENALSAVPMMADKTFIEVYADLTKIKDHETFAKSLLVEDEEHCVLVVVTPEEGFDAGFPQKNKPSTAYKAYSQVLKPVDFAKQTPSELKRWMTRRFSRDELIIAPDAVDLLLERCTKDMFRLSGELDKLCGAALSRGLTVIDTALIYEITSYAEEEDAFALANAVMNGDRRYALEVLAGCKRRQEKAPMVLGSVSKAMCDMLAVSVLMEKGADKAEISRSLKLHEYRAGLYMNAVRDMEPGRLRAAADRCREADILMKSSRLDYIALERLICTIPSKSRAGRRGSWKEKR